MTEVLNAFVNNPWLWIVAIVIVVTICRTISRIVQTIARERTRREIAAYIAEGSMTPDQGERLLRAEPPNDSSCG